MPAGVERLPIPCHSMNSSAMLFDVVARETTGQGRTECPYILVRRSRRFVRETVFDVFLFVSREGRRRYRLGRGFLGKEFERDFMLTPSQEPWYARFFARATFLGNHHRSFYLFGSHNRCVIFGLVQFDTLFSMILRQSIPRNDVCVAKMVRKKSLVAKRYALRVRVVCT